FAFLTLSPFELFASHRLTVPLVRTLLAVGVVLVSSFVTFPLLVCWEFGMCRQLCDVCFRNSSTGATGIHLSSLLLGGANFPHLSQWPCPAKHTSTPVALTP